MLNPTEIHQSFYCNPIFQHNQIMSFWINFLNMASGVTPRKTCYTLVSTYQKGLERLHLIESNQDSYSLRYPSLILQPGPLEIDEQINMLWYSPNMFAEHILKKFSPTIKFADLSIWVVPSRWKVTFDVFYLTESYPEIHNAVMHFYNFFKNKRFYRFNNLIQGSVYISNDMVSKITDEYQDNMIELAPQIPFIVDNSINRSLFAIPQYISPLVRITSHSDGSNYMGDTELPTYRVNFNFEAWLSLPSFLIFKYEPTYDMIVLDLAVEQGKQQQVATSLEFMRFRPDDKLLTMIILGDFDDPTTLTINRVFPISETEAIFVQDPSELTFELVKKESGIRTLVDNTQYTIDEVTDDYIKVTFSGIDSSVYNLEVLYNFGQ